jgi:DNA-binding CsgD family transcriptional regulator
MLTVGTITPLIQRRIAVMQKMWVPSDEFIISHHQGGVKLLLPDEAYSNKLSHELMLKNVLDYPMNVYFTGFNHHIVKVNPFVQEILRSNSISNYVGKCFETITTKKSAYQLRIHDEAVMQSRRTLFFDEVHTSHDDKPVANYFSIKTPWYDEYNNIIGIFGCAINLNTPAFTQSFEYLFKLRLLSSTLLTNSTPPIPTNRIIDGIYITKRESEILYHLVAGKSAKQIGIALTISARTVERHIENIKIKFNAHTKMDLLAKIYFYFA